MVYEITDSLRRPLLQLVMYSCTSNIVAMFGKDHLRTGFNQADLTIPRFDG